MGNHSEKPQPQFDHDPRLNHGSLVPASADPGGDEMESLYEQGLLCHGDLSNDVLPADLGRAGPKEHQERPPLLPGELKASPWSLPSPVNDEPRQPIRFLDCVPGMRGPSLLLLTEGSDVKVEGQGPWQSNGERGIPHQGENNTCCCSCEELSRGGGCESGPVGSLHGHSGDVCWVPADEFGNEGSGSRAKSDAADDDSRPGDPGVRDEPERPLLGGPGHGEGEHGRGRGAHRGPQPGRLVSREPPQPQPPQLSGPPGVVWPRWMMLSAPYGGGPGSWVVHHPLLPGQDWTSEAASDLPEHLRASRVTEERRERGDE